MLGERRLTRMRTYIYINNTVRAGERAARICVWTRRTNEVVGSAGYLSNI